MEAGAAAGMPQSRRPGSIPLASTAPALHPPGSGKGWSTSQESSTLAAGLPGNPCPRSIKKAAFSLARVMTPAFQRAPLVKAPFTSGQTVPPPPRGSMVSACLHLAFHFLCPDALTSGILLILEGPSLPGVADS